MLIMTSELNYEDNLVKSDEFVDYCILILFMITDRLHGPPIYLWELRTRIDQRKSEVGTVLPPLPE